MVFSHEGGIFLLIWAGHLNFNPDPEFDTFPLHSPGGHSSRKPSSLPRRPLAARAPACSTLTQDLKLMDTAEVRLGENKTGRRRLSRRKKKYNFCVLDWAGHIFGTALLCQPGRVVGGLSKSESSSHHSADP